MPVRFVIFQHFVAIKILQRFKLPYGSVLMLTDKICVKYGSRINLSEASDHSSSYSENTDIPVPKDFLFISFIQVTNVRYQMGAINGNLKS